MLCTTCQLAVAGKSDVYKPDELILSIEFVHHRDYSSLRFALESGCGICSLICSEYCKATSDAVSILESGCLTTHSFHRHENKPDLDEWTFHFYSTQIGDAGRRIANVVFDVMRDEGDTPNGQFSHASTHTFSSPVDQSRLQDINHEVNTRTDSLACVNLAHEWLSHCQSNHADCMRTDSVPHPLPLRVIDVGLSGESYVRLHVPTAPQRDRYLTLSHCWGNADILTLNTGNEAELRAGISIRRLPKTFRDAVYFTRALSVRYLWIDSLCILQDSFPDWDDQSARMGDIYRHCFCNIAATLSSNSHGGLFKSRVPGLIQPQRLHLRWKTIADKDWQEGIYFIWPSLLWQNQVENTPLNKRGWVIQERVLAPRIIHFSNQLFWECQTTSACEIAPTGQPMLCRGSQSFYRDLVTTLEKLSHDERDACEGKKNHFRHLVRRSWWQLVQKYTACGLTNPTDILRAVEGIAVIMEEVLGDEYHAGVWCKSLFFDLLWTANDPTGFAPPKPRSTRHPFRAPTWSWASIEGQIWPNYNIHPGEEPLAILCSPVSTNLWVYEDRFSRTTRCQLTVLGRVIEGLWKPPHDQLTDLVPKIRLCIDNAKFRGCLEIDTVEDWLSLKARTEPVVQVLPLLLSGSSFLMLRGLVIEPVDERGNAFRRIGIFTVSLEEGTAHQQTFEERLKTYQQVEASEISLF
jgi:hypothetical protein